LLTIGSLSFRWSGCQDLDIAPVNDHVLGCGHGRIVYSRSRRGLKESRRGR
jgi:hypothetical protein